MGTGRITDTIAAVATAMGSAGIGIVRISASEAITVADRVFESGKKGKRLADVDSHTVHYGVIKESGVVLDEVLAVVMRGPHSYTGEDTVEINCHGGILVTRKILETVIRAGAEMAEPGEFTKRAFLNGRMDLSQAEAVMDLIHAKNEYAMKNSIRQLKGSVSQKIGKLREQILYHMAYIESALDDPEHISLDGYGEELQKILEPVAKEIERLIRSAHNGKIVSEGIRTVILGKPNAGKSSLMNVLVGEERAIVTDVAGTTRDVLEEPIRFGDVFLKLMDTAGIRETADVVEQIGVVRAREAANEADLILYVVDGGEDLDENDEKIMDWIEGKKAIVLLNKADLSMKVEVDELKKKTGCPVVVISAREETGIEDLEKIVERMFLNGEIEKDDEVMITNTRHKSALESAFQSIKMVLQGVESGVPEDFLTIDLMEAYGKLGTIIGEAVGEDLVNEIFERFCMGK